MEVPDVRNLKSLEAENAQLKKLLAERMMDASIFMEMLKKLLRSGSRRKAVAEAMKEKQYSQSGTVRWPNLIRLFID